MILKDRKILNLPTIALLALLALFAGCGDGGKDLRGYSGTSDLYNANDPNPLDQVEVILNLLAVDVLLKESESQTVAEFQITGDHLLTEAIAKSALIAGLVAQRVESDKRLLLVGYIDEIPASAIEVDLQQARAFIDDRGPFEFGDGFRVIDLDSIEAL